VNTATAEGWGLVSFEHAATGAAQVLPRHSAFACLWEESAVLVEPAAVRQLFPHLEERIVDAADVAAAFETLYSDRAHRTGMAQAAYRNATRPQFAWSHIAEQWKTLFFQQLGR
jgi:glycosyltransferase involved in cell wall biosynthesis